MTSVIRGAAFKRRANRRRYARDLRTSVVHAEIDVEPALLIDDIEESNGKPSGANRVCP